MRLVRLLIYALAALVGLYVLAAVLYAIPMVGGLIDDTMEVKFDRPDPSIVADYGNGLNSAQRQGFYHLSQGSEIMPWIVLTAVDVADPGSAKAFVENLGRYGLLPDPGRERRIACWSDRGVQPVHVWHGLRRGELRRLPCGRAASRRQSRAGRRRAQYVQPAALLLGRDRRGDGRDERSRQAVACAQAPGAAGLRALRDRRAPRPPSDPRLSMARTC